MVHRIALIRHGESVWNLENIFTGWTDVDLSSTGVKEAVQVHRRSSNSLMYGMFDA